MCCEKCTKLFGVVLFIFGVLFLLQDIGIWAFWNINWWTVTYILVGLGVGCTSCCPMCKTDRKK